MGSWRWTRILAAILAGAVLLLAAIGGFVSLTMNQMQGNITALDVSEQIGSPTASAPAVVDEAGSYEPFTVLLMGSDTRQGKENRGYGKANEIGGERSDTTILLHVSADRSHAVAVSIPRDTLITLPTCKRDGKQVGGYQGRFNEAIELAGPGCTLKAVQEMTGLPIEHFMVVDFGGFKRIVDSIGGVEICVAEDVNDSQSGLRLTKGTHVVKGEEALAFVRARKTLGDGSDTSRIRRQQAFLSSTIRQVLSSDTLLNPVKLVNVLNAATESLTADPFLADLQNLQDLALSMRQLKPKDITFTTMPWYPSGDGATVLQNKKRAKALWQAIADDTAWPPKGESDQPVLRVEPNTIRVDVLNGTSTKGLAKKVAKQLRKEGYRVMEVGNTKTPAAQTTVIYDPDWDNSAKTLIYATTAEAKSEPGHGQRMTLVIGDDFTAVQPVKISDQLKDKTANLNTADESFCAA
ncbi:MAG: LCP family protein [Actinomycetales bacterium]|nr:LCP family protein [Actinomycetales bacterium]